jgi:hypothetical protein
MNLADIHTIEEKLKILVPAFWKQTVSQYPFRPDSLAAEGCLYNTVESIIETNEGRGGWEMDHAFFIGEHLEVYFFLDLNQPDSGVFGFLVAEWSQFQEAKTWDEFVGQISMTYEEINDLGSDDRDRGS